MRINAVSRVFESYQVQSAAAAMQTEKKIGMDQIELSNEAKDYSNITKLLSDIPDIRTKKVEELKEKINSNAYHVTGEQAAEKILSKLDIRG